MIRGRATTLVALEFNAQAGRGDAFEHLKREAIQIITAVLEEALGGGVHGAGVILCAFGSLIEVLDDTCSVNGRMGCAMALAVNAVASTGCSWERIAGGLIGKVAIDLLKLLANRSVTIEVSSANSHESKRCSAGSSLCSGERLDAVASKASNSVPDSSALFITCAGRVQFENGSASTSIAKESTVAFLGGIAGL